MAPKEAISAGVVAWRVTLLGAEAVIADLHERLQATEDVLAIVTGARVAP